jgi:hypothetical protein
MDEQHSDILIIGAGMAGLSCATRLAASDLTIRVLDKGRGPGGRMAARRAEIDGEAVSFDHGAQYFTVRDPAFRDAVLEWERLGAAAPWPAAGSNAWVGIPGMNGPIKAMSQALNVHWSTRAETIVRGGDIWSISSDRESFTAATVLVAVPAEQAQVLLTGPAPTFAKVAGAVESAPCWAVMAGFDRQLGIEQDALRDPDAAISWAARNSAKPARTGTECWVLHASPERSRAIIDLPPQEAGALLLDDFFAQTNAAPIPPIHLAAHRWLYALPTSIKGEPARFDAEACIGIAGDYLHSPRVEGAWISGTALAAEVLARR